MFMTLCRFAHVCVHVYEHTFVTGDKYLCEETLTEKKKKEKERINRQSDRKHKRINNRKVNKLQSKVFDT